MKALRTSASRGSPGAGRLHTLRGCCAGFALAWLLSCSGESGPDVALMDASSLRDPAAGSLVGYRRLTYMMLDADVVAVSAASVYRVLKKSGVLNRHNSKASGKGKGFHQPSGPHRPWHVDISYLNIAGTFYFLCTILDGYSRYIVHWEIRQKMEEIDVETIVQRAREKFPGEAPRIISDNGPQFIAKEFKQFIRL